MQNNDLGFNRRQFLKLMAAGTAAVALPKFLFSCSLSAEKPNILFILADDMGWSQLGCYGSSYYETPNIDRLAEHGMRFTNAYAACPVCSPTRASIMTGKYPARLHLTDYIPGNPFPFAKLQTPDWQKFLPLDEGTIAEDLESKGYKTAIYGKWHLSIEKKPPESLPYNPDKQGFDDYIVTYKPKSDQSPDDAHNVEVITKKALQFLEQNRDNPFFLFVSHNTIHGPLKEKSDLVEKYRRKSDTEQHENNPVLGAMIETLDESTGRLLDKLEELRLVDNTIVIFFSDNGGLEEHAAKTPFRGGKATLYEGGIRVPLIVRWPGVVEKGSQSDAIVSSVDFLPTLNEIAGINKTTFENIDGISIFPVLSHTDKLNREAIYWHYPHYHSSGIAPSGAVRKGDWKLIEWYDTTIASAHQRFELFKLRDDPGESRNLADVYPQKREEMAKLLADWREKVGAQMMLPNPDYDPKRLNLKK